MNHRYSMLGTPPHTPALSAKDEYAEEASDSLFDVSVGNNTTLDEESFASMEKSDPYISPVSLHNPDFSVSPKVEHENFHHEKKGYVLKDEHLSQYKHYKLHHRKLEDFVLPRSFFNVKLLDRLGTGSNSYVYGAAISSPAYGPRTVAIKIPGSRSKVKYLEREALFIVMLKQFRSDIGESVYEYPFIDAHGLYYLNREDFNLIKKNEELPCLIMKKMSCNLTQFIKERRNYARPEQIAIGKRYWCKLCGTLLHALKVLKALRSVHCDLKTDNVMISFSTKEEERSPIFKIGDFSSASTVEELHGLPDTTLQFSAPELIDSSSGVNASTQTDLFSCGMILLTAATGRMPYQAYSYDQIYLVSLAAKNKVLEVLERESLNILRANPEIYHLIIMIIKDRCTLDDALSYYRRSWC